MQYTKEGDTVTVTYEGRLENGEVFEKSADNGPLIFEIGDGSVFPAFERAVIGMAAGESKTIVLQPEEGFGVKRQELVQTFNRQSFGSDIEPQPGMVLGVTVERNGEQHQVPAQVTAADNETVALDFNHPLAGERLIYTLTLDSIGEAVANGCQCQPAGDDAAACAPGCGCSG